MRNCSIKSEEHTDRLLAYCARRLDSQAADAMERHMDACLECSAFRQTQRAVWSALDSWETPPVSMEFNRRLYAKIEAAEALAWYSRWIEAIRPVFAQPAFALGAATLVIVGGFLLDHPERLSPVTGVPVTRNVVKVSAVEAEQVEKTLDDLEMLHQFDANSDQSSEDKEKTFKSM